MTIRRASGARDPQQRGSAVLPKATQPLRAGALRCGALLAGGLLLPAHGLLAAVHPTHSHGRPGTESAGKASARTVHEVSTREDTGRNARNAHEPGRAAAAGKDHGKKDRSATADTKSHSHTRHADEAGEPAPASTRTHKSRHPHEQQVDDPAPSYRAQAEPRHRESIHARNAEARHEIAAGRTPAAHASVAHAVSAHATATRPVRSREALAAPAAPEAGSAENAHIGTGLTVDDFVRSSRRAPTYTSENTPAAFAENEHAAIAPVTGVSHPDDDERLPMHSATPVPAASVRTQHASSPVAHPVAAAPAHTDAATQPEPVLQVSAAPDVAPLVTTSSVTAIATALTRPAPARPPVSEVVEGFGAEVDLRTPLAKPTASSTPRESPAQQERELRDAAEVASAPMFIPLYARDGSLMVPPPLKGSHDILVHQNQMADDAGLTRIQDDDDLARLRRAHLLIDFPESASLRMNESLPENRRNARPWTVKFAVDIAHAFYNRFGEPLQVNSAVRTVAYQLRLQRVNGNAAAIDGEGASPHLTGQALDFGKRGMSMSEIAWMRSYLLPLMEAGKIDVEEEFQQACFHISVYTSYVPVLAPKTHAPVKTFVAQVNKPVHAHAAGLAAVVDTDGDLR